MLRVTDNQLSVPGFEWPIKYSDLAPYYSEIEQFLEMGGGLSGRPDVPDGQYVRERTLNPLERKFCEAVERRWPRRSAVVNHVAEYEPGPLSPMLKAAFGNGGLKLFADKAVAALVIGTTNRVAGVTTVSTKTGAVETFRAPFVILAASAFETVRILLNSRSERFPNGVGNHNGLVGTRILEHITASYFGELPAAMRSEHPAHSHNPFKLNAEPHGFYIPPFSHLENPQPGYRFGYGVQGTISADTGLVYTGAFGETVPNDANRLFLDSTRIDRFGIPVAAIEFSWGSEDLAMWKHAHCAVAEMIEAFEKDISMKLNSPLTSKVANLLAKTGAPFPGSNHECGGARMGQAESCSVVNSYGRVWEAPNLLVCDSACFPSIPHQNPTLTMMALAVRSSRHLLKNA